MLSYHPTNRPTIADIIAHPWLKQGHTATQDEVREELFHRERVNKEKVKTSKRNSEQVRRDLKFPPEDPSQAARESMQIDNEVQELEMREFDQQFQMKRSTYFFSNKEPKALFKELKRALQKHNQKGAQLKSPHWRFVFDAEETFIDEDQ